MDCTNEFHILLQYNVLVIFLHWVKIISYDNYGGTQVLYNVKRGRSRKVVRIP